MRTVLQGTSKKLRRLTAGDLPEDCDLRYSNWTWVDLDGYDLSAYDCRYMDAHDCDGTDVVLPNDLTGFVPLRSTWTGAAIPRSLPFCSWSLVNEVLRRHTARPGSREAEMIEWVDALIQEADTDVRDPWLVSAEHFKDAYGLDAGGIYDVFATYAFDGYPSLLRVLRWCVDQPVGAAAASAAASIGLRDPSDPSRPVSIPRADLRPFGTEDRWSAARMVETYLDTTMRTPGWNVEMLFAAPTPHLVIVHRSEVVGDDWRERAWPS